MECFNNTIPNINYSTFGKWLMYYYHAWTGKESKCIIREFDDFRLNKHLFDIDTYKQFNDDIWRYWCYVGLSTNELGLVACRIFGICVNAASVERLWSCMGFLQTNRRCHTHSLTISFSSFHLARFCHSYTRCELEAWKPSLIPFCKRKYYRTWVSCYSLFNH